MTFEKFCDKFNELRNSDKVAVYREYCLNVQSYGIPEVFDEEFFDIYFSSTIDAARAVFFGHIQNWSDEYIRFDAYGNLESLSEGEVLEEIDERLEDMYNEGACWSYYIDDEDDEEDDEDLDD